MKISINFKKIKKGLFFLLVLSFFLFPVVFYAQGLVECTENCGWNELLALINRVINFILFRLAIPIAAIMFAYAGILLLTSGGDSSKKTKAKEVFSGVAIGLVVAAAAWLIVHVILSILGYTGASWIGF